MLYDLKYKAQKAEAEAKKAEEARLAEEKAVAEKAEAERLANEAAIAEAKANANTKLLEEIRDLLKKNNSIDFDDIIMLTVKVFLNNPERLQYYQNKFKYIQQ